MSLMKFFFVFLFLFNVNFSSASDDHAQKLYNEFYQNSRPIIAMRQFPHVYLGTENNPNWFFAGWIVRGKSDKTPFDKSFFDEHQKERFLAFYITAAYVEKSEKAHAIGVIVDQELKTIEYYNPWGKYLYNDFYYHLIKEELLNWKRFLGEDFRIVRAVTYPHQQDRPFCGAYLTLLFELRYLGYSLNEINYMTTYDIEFYLRVLVNRTRLILEMKQHSETSLPDYFENVKKTNLHKYFEGIFEESYQELFLFEEAGTFINQHLNEILSLPVSFFLKKYSG